MDIIKELEQRGRLASMLTKVEIARIVGVYKKQQLAIDLDSCLQQKEVLDKRIALLTATKDL